MGERVVWFVINREEVRKPIGTRLDIGVTFTSKGTQPRKEFGEELRERTVCTQKRRIQRSGRGANR